MSCQQFVNQRQSPRKSRFLEHLNTETSFSLDEEKRQSLGKKFVRRGSNSRSKSRQRRRVSAEMEISFIKNPFQPHNISKNKPFFKHSISSNSSKKAVNRQLGSTWPSSQSVIEPFLLVEKPQESSEEQEGSLKRGQQQESWAILEDSSLIIKQFEQQLSSLQQRLRQKEIENTILLEKLHSSTGKETNSIQSRCNNLTKLKKQIALSKNAQVLPSHELLETKIKEMSVQNYKLKQKADRLQTQLKQYEQKMQRIAKETQSYLHSMINSLKQQLIEKERLLFDYQIRLNIHFFRQQNRGKNKELEESEQKSYFKLKNDHLVKQYNQLSQDYESLSRKNDNYQKQNYMLRRDLYSSMCVSRDEAIDFSLSP